MNPSESQFPISHVEVRDPNEVEWPKENGKYFKMDSTGTPDWARDDANRSYLHNTKYINNKNRREGTTPVIKIDSANK